MHRCGRVGRGVSACVRRNLARRNHSSCGHGGCEPEGRYFHWPSMLIHPRSSGTPPAAQTQAIPPARRRDAGLTQHRSWPPSNVPVRGPVRRITNCNGHYASAPESSTPGPRTRGPQWGRLKVGQGDPRGSNRQAHSRDGARGGGVQGVPILLSRSGEKARPP